MQAIRPQHLTDEEVLHQVYLMGNENLPKEWVEEMCTRMARLIDENDAFTGAEYKEKVIDAEYHRGFEDGFEAGVEHANEE